MVNWRSPEVQELCQQVYVRIVLFLIGVYFWNFLLSLSAVEIPLLFRKARPTLIHIPYLIGRYCAVVSTIVMSLLIQEVNLEACSRLNKAFPLLSSFIVICSSTNIMMRPVALFRRNTFVLCVLIAFMLGHWGLGLAAIITSIIVVPSHMSIDACGGVIPFGPHLNYGVIVFYVYTLAWDAIILFFTVYGLLGQMPVRSSALWSTLRSQGVGYLVVTTCLNVPALVLSCLNLNGPMNIIFAVPGGLVSVMVSSAAVVSLLRMKCDPSSHQPVNADSSKSDDVPVPDLLTTHIVLNRNPTISAQ